MQMEQGVSLIELLVVMSLMTLALTMFGSAFSLALRAADRSRDLGAATDQVRLALSELDRQIRYGYWIHTTAVPGLVCPEGESSCAIRVLTNDGPASTRCWAWALDPASHSLKSYNWAPVGRVISLPEIGTWHVVAGPEGEIVDDVLVGGSLLVDESSEGRALNGSTLGMTSYYKTALLSVTVTRGGGSFQTDIAMTARNPLVGAPLVSEC